MARQRIDLDINAQRLLGANKERAAANRSAYVDRGERKRTAAQAASTSTPTTTTGAPTQNEEPRGGTPDLYSPPEPAASRRKKKGVEVYGISNINRFTVDGSVVESSQNFTGYGSDYEYHIESFAGEKVYVIDYYNVAERQFTNSYRLEATRWRPEFNQELQNSRRFFLGEAYTIENSITQLDWTFDLRSSPPFFAVELAVAASPPALPFLLEDKVSTTNNAFRGTYWENQGGSLTRSDGKYIYHSRLVIKCRPGPAILYSGFDPDTGLVGPSVYDGNNFEGVYNTFTQNGTTYLYQMTQRGIGNPTFRWYTQGNFGYGNYFDFYGLYWRFDPSTGTTTFSSSFIGTLEDSDWVFDYELDQIVPAWFDGMHLGDPSRRLWKAYEGNYSTMFSFLVEDFLYESTSFLQRWPPGLVYNEETGVLTIVTGLNGLDTPRIFSKDIGPNVNYFTSIPVIHLPTGYNEFLTTEQDFLDAGWTAEGPIPQNVLDPLDAYFAFKP